MSVPMKPSLGLYVTVPFALTVAVPFAGLVAIATVAGGYYPSISLGPNQRYAARGAHIVKFSAAGRRVLP